ncbi:unnamed protein product [Coccothraustes coccothraustes]
MERESQSGKVCLPAAASEIHLNAGSRSKAAAEWHTEIPWLDGACSMFLARSLPAVSGGTSQPFGPPPIPHGPSASGLQLCTPSLGYGGGFPNRPASGTEVSKILGCVWGQTPV